jgi:hypothetical protein
VFTKANNWPCPQPEKCGQHSPKLCFTTHFNIILALTACAHISKSNREVQSEGLANCRFVIVPPCALLHCGRHPNPCPFIHSFTNDSTETNPEEGARTSQETAHVGGLVVTGTQGGRHPSPCPFIHSFTNDSTETNREGARTSQETAVTGTQGGCCDTWMPVCKARHVHSKIILKWMDLTDLRLNPKPV